MYGDDAMEHLDQEMPVTIEYHRQWVSNNALGDYVVVINGVMFVWSSVVDYQGSKDHLHSESRDQITLKRAVDPCGQPTSRVEQDATVLKGIRRVQDDIHYCNVLCRTQDPDRCLPAIYAAWRCEVAAAKHSRWPAVDLIRKYVTLYDNDHLAADTRPYFNASLQLRLKRTGLPTGGPQIHWDGSEYDDELEKTRAENMSRWQLSVIANATNAATGLRNQTAVTYLFDWNNCLDYPCVHSLRHFHPYSPRQIRELGLVSPQEQTALSERIIPGCLKIPLDDGEKYVQHGVLYCESFTYNILVVHQTIVTTKFVPTKEALVSPNGTAYLLKPFRDTDSIGILYDLLQRDRVRCLTVVENETLPVSPVRQRRIHAEPAVDLGHIPLTVDRLPANI